MKKSKKTMLSLTSSLFIGLLFGVFITQAVLAVKNVSVSIDNEETLVNLSDDEYYSALTDIRNDIADCYVYGTLTAEERIVYEEIYFCMQNHNQEILVSTAEPSVLDTAYKAVFADHGNIFWVSGYSYTEYTRGGQHISLSFSPKYTMDYDTRESYQNQIDMVVNDILNGLDTGETEYAKAKYVYDYLSYYVDYAPEVSNSQNIISPFLYHATVCQGYACATQYLLSLLGIQSAIVTGDADGVAHTWNLVRINGNYYFMDTTLGNAVYADDSGQNGKFANYTYFLITTSELLKTHIPRDYFFLPECSSIEDNYYVREGLYITEWDPDYVGSIFHEAYIDDSKNIATVKFSSQELYDKAKVFFVEEQNIAIYCPGIRTLDYIANYRHYILTFKF